MKIYLREKAGAFTSPIKDAILPKTFPEYYLGKDNINEELLINDMSNNFLPKDYEFIAIMVEDEINENSGRVLSNTGQRGLSIFKDYDKYTNKYSLLLCRYE